MRNEPCCCWWTSLGERCSFRGQRGLARPECAGFLSSSGYGCSSLRHKAPLHILLYPVHCGSPALEAHGSRGCFGAKCLSCHWPVQVPVQLLETLRCSSRTTSTYHRRQLTFTAQVTPHGQDAATIFKLKVIG